MINISIFILVILCLIVVNTGLTIKTSLGTKCNCMPEKEIPEELNDINIKDFLIEEEIINGINFGRPIFIHKGLVLLRKDIKVMPHIEAMDVCQPGWRVPTKNEIIKVMTKLKNETYKSFVNTANYNPDKIYVLKEKVFNTFDPKDNNAYIFNAIEFSSLHETLKIFGVNTFLNKNVWAKCVLDVETSPINLRLKKHFHHESLTTNNFYNAILKNTNIVARIWKYGNIISNSTLFPIRFLNEECNTIQVFTKHLTGEVRSTCKSYKNATIEESYKSFVDQIEEKIYNKRNQIRESSLFSWKYSFYTYI